MSLFVLHDGSLGDLVSTWKNNWGLFGNYIALAVTYAVYDNLTFAALGLLSPFTYQIVMQLRLVVTAITWQVLFQKRLSMRQWCSIVVISSAIAFFNANEAASQPDPVSTNDDDETTVWAERTAGILLALVQILCTVLAGVANEYFIKKKASTVPLNLQNCFMFVWCFFILVSIYWTTIPSDLLM